MRVKVVLLLIFVSAYCMAQSYDGFPVITLENIDKGKILSERTFSKESLFGYMNGGAELYLEYGFDRLHVYEIEIDGVELKAEVYKMNDSDAAYGIYSVSVFRCDSTNHLPSYSCQSAYQLQICKGDYYISIVNSTGQKTGVALSMNIAKKLLPAIKGRSHQISDFLHGINLDGEVQKTILFRGELGLSNGAYDWYDILKDTENYSCLLVETNNESIICLRFEDDTSQLEFLASLDVDTHPAVNDEHNLAGGLKLAVNYENVIMIRRAK